MIKITSFKDLVDAIDVGIRNGVFTINEGRERVEMIALIRRWQMKYL